MESQLLRKQKRRKSRKIQQTHSRIIFNNYVFFVEKFPVFLYNNGNLTDINTEDITMANVKELLKAEENGSLSFGDYSLTQKTKLDDFSFEGDTYKVKTFQEITRLEKNGGVVYESVPGSAVHGYKETERQIVFETEAADDLQITLEVEPEKEYKVYVNDTNIGKLKSSLSGKISFSIELDAGETAKVQIVK